MPSTRRSKLYSRIENTALLLLGYFSHCIMLFVMGFMISLTLVSKLIRLATSKVVVRKPRKVVEKYYNCRSMRLCHFCSLQIVVVTAVSHSDTIAQCDFLQ